MEIMKVLVIDTIRKLYEVLSIDWEKYYIHCQHTDSYWKAFNILHDRIFGVFQKA